jgi:small ligand-binding sensory domain FIST
VTANRATSFCATGSDIGAFVAALDPVRRAATPLSGAILFASGQAAREPMRLLEAAQAELGPIPLILGVASGVLTDRGEVEHGSAVAGVCWRGGTVTPVVTSSDAAEAGAQIAEQARTALGSKAGTLVVLGEPRKFSHHTLDDVAPLGPELTVVGAGTLPGGAYVCGPSIRPTSSAAVGLLIGGSSHATAEVASACKLLAPFAPVTAVRGPMVLRLGDEPALDRMASCARGLAGQPLVLAVIAPPERESDRAGVLLVRAIRGVDPDRRGVVVTDEAKQGMLMSFAVCDAASSRADAGSKTRSLKRRLGGGAPEFGLVMSCASRGTGLYGEADVDIGIMRQRFPNLPFAGIHSSFEIGPFLGRPAMHLYSCVLAVFASPN